MTNATYHIAATSRLIEVEGEDQMETREVWYVTVELDSGRRWAHDGRYVSARHHNTAAVAQAERLVARIQAAVKAGTWAGPVGNPHWVEIEPAYGSIDYAAEAEKWEAQKALDDDEYEPDTAREYELRALAAAEYNTPGFGGGM